MARGFLLFIRVSLPFILAVSFNISPEIVWVRDALSAARRLGSAGQPVTAASQYQRVLDVKPWRGDLWELAAIQRFTARQWQEAADSFLEAAGIGMLTSGGKVVYGDTLVKLGREENALQVWNSLLEGDIVPPQAFSHLVDTYRSRGLLPKAVETLQLWYSSYPDDPQAAYLLGISLLSQKPWEADSLLEKAAARTSVYGINAALLRQSIPIILSTQPGQVRSLEVGRALSRIGEWDLAEAAFNEAVRLSPDSAEAWALLAEVRQNRGLSGMVEIQKALSLDPGSIIVRALTARYWMRRGSPGISLAYLYALSEDEPGSCVWQVQIGAALAALGNISGALGHYQAAVEVDPGSFICWQALADFSVENEIEVRAVGLPAARQAALLFPQDPAGLNAMGNVMMALQDRSLAERFYLRSLSVDQNYAPAHLGVGILYLEQGDKSRAYAHIREAESMSPSGSRVNLIAHQMITRYY